MPDTDFGAPQRLRDNGPAGSQSLPNVLIIGAARAGSTFLVKQLSQHREIACSNPKETHFLSLGHLESGFEGPDDATTINRQIIHTIEDYEAAFLGAHDAAVRIDASVSMLYHPGVSIEAISRYLGDNVRVIVVLRDPVERAYSAFKYLQNRGSETLETFEEALDAEEKRIAENWHHLWHYSSMSRYAEQLEPWLNAFGDRLQVVDYEKLTNQSEDVVRNLVGWLGLKPELVHVDSRAVNSSGELRSPAVQNLLSTCRNLGWMRAAVKATIPFAMRERIRSMNLRGSAVPTAARDRLMGDLEDDIARLRELLGPMSPQWLD
ncbi:MAG: sulfotransferase [Acidimicrobiales bacterium]